MQVGPGKPPVSGDGGGPVGEAREERQDEGHDEVKIGNRTGNSSCHHDSGPVSPGIR